MAKDGKGHGSEKGGGRKLTSALNSVGHHGKHRGAGLYPTKPKIEMSVSTKGKR